MNHNTGWSGSSAFIFGKGAHGRVVAETMAECGVTLLGWLDDNGLAAEAPARVMQESIDARCEWGGPVPNVYVAIGSPPVREQVTMRLVDMGFQVAPALVHPRAYISRDVTIGKGTVVLPDAVVHTGAIVGKHVLLNLQSIVHHDAVVEDYVTISPQAQVCGRCNVGKGAFLAVRSCLMFPHRLGAGAILAAHSVSFESIPDGELWTGIPAWKRRNVDEETWRKCF